MLSKQQKIENFDPSQPGLADATIYGLPFNAEESEIIILPAPWEVTVSYGSGASEGPEAIFNASFQVDLLHQEFPDLWKLGIYMDEAPEQSVKNMQNQSVKMLFTVQILTKMQKLKRLSTLQEESSFNQLIQIFKIHPIKVDFFIANIINDLKN